MQEKTAHSKETDITAFLVITFTVLVAILIAKVAGDFTKQTTSTQTRAETPPPYANDTDFCRKEAKKTGVYDRYIKLFTLLDTGKVLYAPINKVYAASSCSSTSTTGVEISRYNFIKTQDKFVDTTTNPPIRQYTYHVVKCCLDKTEYNLIMDEGCNTFTEGELLYNDPNTGTAYIAAPLSACVQNGKTTRDGYTANFTNTIFYNWSTDSVSAARLKKTCRVAVLGRFGWETKAGKCKAF